MRAIWPPSRQGTAWSRHGHGADHGADTARVTDLDAAEGDLMADREFAGGRRGPEVGAGVEAAGEVAGEEGPVEDDLQVFVVGYRRTAGQRV